MSQVLRSYQYQAVNAISDRVRTCKWDEPVPSGTPGRPGSYVCTPLAQAKP